MSEEQDDHQQDKPAEFAPITSQEDFDKALSKRLERERNKFADYDALRDKASKFDEAQEASKTELQKATERAEQAERRATESEQTSLKTRIASEMGVIPEVITGTDEAAMRASAQRVLEWAAQGKRTPPKPTSLTSGSAASPKTGEAGRAAAAIRNLRRG